MNIKHVVANNHKKAFELRLPRSESNALFAPSRQGEKRRVRSHQRRIKEASLSFGAAAPEALEVQTPEATVLFPYSQADPRPSNLDRVVRVFPDEELGCEGFTYVLQSGKEGTIHVEQVLEYNRDPRYLRDLLLYNLTIEAQTRIEASGLSKREVIRRLGTSPAQFYRLLDQTNYRKSVDQMVSLLQVLGCDVALTVSSRSNLNPETINRDADRLNEKAANVLRYQVEP